MRHNGLKERLGKGFLLVLAAFPVVYIGQLVFRYGVNVVYQDQFEMVPLLQRQLGDLGPSDFWYLHNEHRPFFPRMIMYALAKVTGWNTRFELGVNILMALGIFFLLCSLMRTSLRELTGSAVFGAMVAAVSIVVFSPVQFNNWMVGWQMHWFLGILGFVAAVAALYSGARGQSNGSGWSPAKSTVLAVFAGVIGQYSLASGALIWPACLPFFLWKPLRRWALLWIGAGGISTALYLRNYPAGGLQVGQLDAGEIWDFVAYYLGRPLLYAKPGIGPPSYAAGTVIAALFVGSCVFILAMRRRDLIRALPWSCMGLWVGLSAFITALGRGGEGPRAAEPSRYTSISLLMVISVFALLVIIFGKPEPTAHAGNLAANRGSPLSFPSFRPFPAFVLAVAVAAVFLLRYPSETRLLKQFSEELVRERKCLNRVTDPKDPCLLLAYPDTHVAFERSRYLKQLGWAGLKPDNMRPR